MVMQSPAVGGRACNLAVCTPYGRGGGSSRVRVYDWLDHLGLSAEVHDYAGGSTNGLATLTRHPGRTAAAEIRTRRMSSAGRVLLLSREASPLSSGRLEGRLLRTAEHGVYDFDDALFDDRGTGLRRVVGKDRTWRRAVAAADRVIAGNPYLADRASTLCRAVTVIPSCIEPAAYTPKTSWAVNEVPRIVWLGSPSTEQYLLSISRSLREVHRRTGARLLVISAGNSSLNDLDPMVDRLAWTPAAYAAALATGDVAIGPLEDTPYARGKCAYKLLQYAATGLPMVASPVGANARALELLGGVAAVHEEEWTDALVEAITTSTEARETVGRRAITRVAEHYSFARWAPAWRQAVQA